MAAGSLISFYQMDLSKPVSEQDFSTKEAVVEAALRERVDVPKLSLSGPSGGEVRTRQKKGFVRKTFNRNVLKYHQVTIAQAYLLGTAYLQVSFSWHFKHQRHIQ